MSDMGASLAPFATPLIAATGAILVAIIAALSAIAVAAITYWTTKKREREAELRREKLEHYKDFVATLADVISGNRTLENQQAFARACNKLNLVAPLSVIDAFRAFQDEGDGEEGEQAETRRNALMSHLFYAMRDDLSVGNRRDDQTILIRFWTAGTAQTPEHTRSMGD